MRSPKQRPDHSPLRTPRSPRRAPWPLVILLDLDNTLLDTDGMRADFDAYLTGTFGEGLRRRFWELYEDVRRDLGVVSFPAALERLHHEAPHAHVYSQGTDFLMRYRFRRRLFPGTPQALRHLRRFGPLVLLSDGDPWFQLKKAADSGIARAVEGNVLIFTHKEQHLEEVRHRYPAAHYAYFDDKPWLLAEVRRRMGVGVTTVWLRQGAYARACSGEPLGVDLVLDDIAHATRLTEAHLRGCAPGPVVPR